MSAPLLQLTAVTKSFGAVRALKGVSFDLRAGDPGQPGGLPDISRGLSTATPPVAGRNAYRTPEGCQNRRASADSKHRREPPAPLQGAFPFRPLTGGVVALRAPQPPANFWQPAGLRCA